MHEPVLLEEVLNLMNVQPGGTYVDGTVGAGGHAEAILRRSGPGGRLLGLDRDAESLERCRARLGGWGGRCVLRHADFADVGVVAREAGFGEADGILFDVGVSSDQLDDAARGLSFAADGPLDMRMDRSRGETAADMLARLDESSLADLLWRLGEERAARRIAKWIVEERARRPIDSTGRLAELVERAKGGRRGRLHPATLTFQALRIAVNGELEKLERGMESGFEVLKRGGRFAVITFHSLEDRIVKQAFARHVGRPASLPQGGQCWEGREPAARWITKKPVTPSAGETARNPRSRSAKLRVVERVN